MWYWVPRARALKRSHIILVSKKQRTIRGFPKGLCLIIGKHSPMSSASSSSYRVFSKLLFLSSFFSRISSFGFPLALPDAPRIQQQGNETVRRIYLRTSNPCMYICMCDCWKWYVKIVQGVVRKDSDASVCSDFVVSCQHFLNVL